LEADLLTCYKREEQYENWDVIIKTLMNNILMKCWGWMSPGEVHRSGAEKI
jgi:hypothetical protein